MACKLYLKRGKDSQSSWGHKNEILMSESVDNSEDGK